MQLLEQAILERGRVKDGEVLKVDAFLNHQMDVGLINELGREFHRRFADAGVTKILTIEASGIGIACITAQYFGVPVVFAKKTQSRNIDGEVLTTQVTSFTHQRNYDVIVSKRFLDPSDRVLLIDDFLAKGSALLGLISLVQQSGASIAGAGICIEKGFDVGGQAVRSQGIRVESLATIASMDANGIVFAPDHT
ncbi:MAG: xanthine phosphoribosyltransferase [Butyricicoccus sp.]|nr:xanthine phosphoribosyltransferase [Butyricicoccus pullicaecorum]MCI6719960.1 xanthine phosphoribosyltransferase [Clostridiales bacterium]MDY5973045.1 xanthine phosphoribosyltransferase [Butyricicoccus sp.]